MKYLALGDSYTIGEQVAFEENFPSQLSALLQARHIPVQLTQLIAVTGWTTDELSVAIAREKPAHDFDLVTLLIGVNNQYRGRSVEEYYWQFYSLLCQANLFAKSDPAHVVVVSIPDWGQTPFNTEKDPQLVSAEIDVYNEINRSLCEQMQNHYVDITTTGRPLTQRSEYLAPDQLHYSALEYARWAKAILPLLIPVFKPAE